MARPLFEIAMEISSDWKTPSPAAKAYLKGMFYLLGVDDHSADLDAATTVRLFLLYSKEWKGSIAERIKAELQEMRSSRHPTNVELLAQKKYPSFSLAIDGCELCDASLGSPGKFVDGYSIWNKRARMCMHCNYFLTQGFEIGDGALNIQHDGAWVHLHGKAKVSPARVPQDASSHRVNAVPTQPNMRVLIRKIVRRTAKKCVGMVNRMFRRAG